MNKLLNLKLFVKNISMDMKLAVHIDGTPFSI